MDLYLDRKGLYNLSPIQKKKSIIYDFVESNCWVITFNIGPMSNLGPGPREKPGLNTILRLNHVLLSPNLTFPRLNVTQDKGEEASSPWPEYGRSEKGPEWTNGHQGNMKDECSKWSGNNFLLGSSFERKFRCWLPRWFFLLPTDYELASRLLVGR